MKKVIISQFIILLVGTVFAWGNFFYELYLFWQKRACTTGCYAAAGPLVNPFFTPCFYGAIFFAVAFILSIVLLRSQLKK